MRTFLCFVTALAGLHAAQASKSFKPIPGWGVTLASSVHEMADSRLVFIGDLLAKVIDPSNNDVLNAPWAVGRARGACSRGSVVYVVGDDTEYADPNGRRPTVTTSAPIIAWDLSTDTLSQVPGLPVVTPSAGALQFWSCSVDGDQLVVSGQYLIGSLRNVPFEVNLTVGTSRLLTSASLDSPVEQMAHFTGPAGEPLLFMIGQFVWNGMSGLLLLDTSTLSLTQVATASTVSAPICGTVSGGKLYVTSDGSMGSLGGVQLTSTDAAEIDLSTSPPTVTALPALPSAVTTWMAHGITASATTGRIYLYGVSDEGHNVWVLDPSATPRQWEPLSQAGTFQGIAGGQVIMLAVTASADTVYMSGFFFFIGSCMYISGARYGDFSAEPALPTPPTSCHPLPPLVGSSSIATGYVGPEHFCMVKSGSVLCMGASTYGEDGSSSPAAVGGSGRFPLFSAASLPKVSQVAIGRDHTCFLLLNGKVSCIGKGANGRLGLGNTANSVDTNQYVSLGADAMQVIAGDDFTCALLVDATVRCWGTGGSGATGAAMNADVGDSGPVSAAPTVPLGFCVDYLMAGPNSVCAFRLASGEYTCFGTNGGKLGNGGTADTSVSPCTGGGPEFEGSGLGISTSSYATSAGVLVAKAVSGKDYTCFMYTDGSVTCAGSNTPATGYGDSGAVHAEHSQTVNMVSGAAHGGTATDITGCPDHVCTILDVNGAKKVKCWGNNKEYQLGYNINADVGWTDEPADHSPLDLPATATPLLITCTSSTTCVLVDDPAADPQENLLCFGKDLSDPSATADYRPKAMFMNPSPSPSPSPSTSPSSSYSSSPTPSTSVSSSPSPSTSVSSSAIPSTSVSSSATPSTSTSRSPGAPSASPTASASPAPRLVVFSLGLVGGSPLLLVQDTAGIASLLREAVAQLASVPTGSVAISTVNASISTSTSNGTELGISNSTFKLNSASTGNTGVNTSGLSYALGSTPARRLAVTTAADQPLCAAVRQVGVVNDTQLAVEFAVDAALVYGWTSGDGDPATFVAHRLHRLLNSTNRAQNSGLVDFAALWSNCTGAVADLNVLMSVLRDPAVMELPHWVASASFLPAGTAAQSSSNSGDDDAKKAAVGGVLGGLALASCCIYFLLLAWRRRHKKEEDKAKQQAKQVPTSELRAVVAGDAGVAATAKDNTAFSQENPMASATPASRAAPGDAAQPAKKSARFRALPAIAVDS